MLIILVDSCLGGTNETKFHYPFRARDTVVVPHVEQTVVLL